MLGSPSNTTVPTQRGLWPLGAVQAPTITTFSNDGFNKYGIYSLFPGGPSFGSTLYSHSSTSSTTNRFTTGQYQPPTDNLFHTSYKAVSDSLFSTTSYTFGAPTPPPGSPYSPVPNQLELLAKGLNTGILQPIDDGIQSSKKIQCNCQIVNPDHKLTDPIQCCTRTTPLKWNEINLKKEISEISTNTSSMIKLEVISPTQTTDIMGNNILNLTEPSRSTSTMTVNSTTMTSSSHDSAMIQCVEDKTTGTRHVEETSYMASPTVWQYSAPVAPVPVEPIVPVPVPVPPLVVRDPNTGGYLLVSTSSLDPLQQVVWPPYQQHSSVILPSMPSVPSPSFQLLPSAAAAAASHCFSGTSFHQQTQAHSTRLVAVTDNKRKIIPTLIKIETDQQKSLQAVSTPPSTVITDVTPLITTHVIYQHPSNFIVSQNSGTETGTCKSQATSPVTCLTPPPDVQHKEVKVSNVQDASNQTEAVGCTSDELSSVNMEGSSEKVTSAVIPDKVEEKQLQEDQEKDKEEEVVAKVPEDDQSGLKLLSNSIDQFESSHVDKEEPKSPAFDGLDLLCALAEQRILEENKRPSITEHVKKRKKDKRKSKKHSYDDPKRKKMKHSHEKKKRKKLKYKLEHECACKGNYELLKVSNNNDEVKKSNEETVEIPDNQEPKKLSYFKKHHYRSKSADYEGSVNINNNFIPLLKPPVLTETPKYIYKENDVDNKQLQKRKVGRPKKLMPFSTEQTITETIVAKKPKSNLIGYFLAAKEKYQLHNAEYQEENTSPIPNKKKKLDPELKSSKIKPKLKAEPTFKSYDEDDDNLDSIKDIIYENNDDNESKKCVLTSDLLKVDKLRVLTAMGGLFYAGQLNAIEPPDVYSIVLDGERGNKPHIMSREEILRDAIVEVSPQSTDDLAVGTRVCAYWSQQYRCLYPGSIAEPSSPDSDLDSKFVLVEFDDGDSGRIDLKDIRLLPSDYPVIEYDLNPLLSLTKRKKRASKTKDTPDEPIEQQRSEIESPEPEPEPEPECEQKHFKKKLLKRLKQEKKRKKKHKYHDKSEKERKHHHHKKHRKHKKRHNRKEIECDNENNAENAEVKDENDEDTDKASYTDNNVVEETIVDVEEEEEDTHLIINNEMSNKKKSNLRDRQESCESRSKMSAFLPARQLWGWAGKEYKRQKVRGRFKKFFYKSIQRGKELITVGDSAVFLSTGRPDRPYIGKIEAMWELCGTMIVKVKWFYHPEETIGCPQNLQYPGALFESPHIDENDVQTISHKCEVVPFFEYRERLGDDPENYAAIYDNNDIYYLAGYYDPTSCLMKMEPGIPFLKT